MGEYYIVRYNHTLTIFKKGNIMHVDARMAEGHTKNKVTISISSEVRKKLEKIGEQYGLKLSNMIERAARYYLADIEDIEIAHFRYTHPEGEPLSGEDVKSMFGVED